MVPDEAVLKVATDAQQAWHRSTSEERRDALYKIALDEILFAPVGSENNAIWLLPRSVAKAIVLDHGCRREGLRLRHDANAPVEIAIEQALALRDFRAALNAVLDLIQDWPSFMKAVRQRCEP